VVRGEDRPGDGQAEPDAGAATIFGMVLALGVLAMSIGLVRSETASDLRTLTATGASGTARRTLTAATAGALAVTGAVTGTAGAYLAAAGFFSTNQLDQLSDRPRTASAGQACRAPSRGARSAKPATRDSKQEHPFARRQ